MFCWFVMQLLNLKTTAWFLLAGLLIPASLAVSQEIDSGVLIESKIATDGDCITLPVKVDGEWCHFVVNTGAPITILDPSFAKRLSPASEPSKRLVPRTSLTLYKSPKIVVAGSEKGSLAFPSERPVACENLETFTITSDLKFSGVLGMDFLSSYALDLDLSQGIVKILDSAKYKSTGNPVVRPITMEGLRPVLSLESNRGRFDGLIATGAMASLFLDKRVAKSLFESGEVRATEFRVEIDGKTERLRGSEARLESLYIGPFVHHDLVVYPEDGTSLIGLYYWRRYHCVFDFPRNRVLLEKSRWYDQIDDSDHAGLYFSQTKIPLRPAWFVERLNVGSRGEEAGVELGDILLSVDGVPVHDSSVHSIFRKLSFRGNRKCNLVVERDGKELSIELRSPQ